MTASSFHRDSREPPILAAQVRLLYSNTNVGVAVTLIAAPALGRLEWVFVPHRIILGWCLYMFLVTVARFTLGRRYWRTAPQNLRTNRWGAAFVSGAGLAGTGWGAAGILLYPAEHLVNQVFLVFILGGMMLGSASLLAPRPEAFLAFIVPTGLMPAVRLVVQGDEAHLAMGLLAALFTLATLITTRRIHLTIVSSLNLRFENQDLVEDLRAAKSHAESLNEQLEVRVQERTSELHRSTEQLLAEIMQREQIEKELADELAERTRNEKEIQSLSARLLTAQEEERRRLARELHDDLSQQIAALSMATGNLKRQIPQQEAEARNQSDRIQQKLVQLAEAVRRMSHELHPAVLEHSGLVSAMQAYCDEFGALTGIRVVLRADGLFDRVPAPVALGLYRITQEALQNVAKHAGTGEAQVALRYSEEMLCLTISDSGVGMELNRANAGLGLVSIRERTRLLHGTVDLWSNPNQGTRVSVRIPEDVAGHAPAVHASAGQPG